MSVIRQKLNELCDHIEKNTRLTEIVLYTASSSLVLYAVIKNRPFTRFTNPRSIPKEFICKNQELKGTVKKIQHNGIIELQHIPQIKLLPQSFFSKTLPVKICGISQVDANGVTWLDYVVKNKDVHFVPLSNESSFFTPAKVFLVENGRKIDISQSLLSLGFAKIDADSMRSSNQNVQKYVKKLKLSERKGKYFHMGMWANSYENILQRLTRKNLEWLIFSLKPLNQKLPPLVRGN